MRLSFFCSSETRGACGSAHKIRFISSPELLILGSAALLIHDDLRDGKCR
jgi:hypothetical protein